ncbi:response regulator transcription factor [Iningainema tapete]|uniref:Response regulator transcription factor n=1 Tax=Iningainema tapete BLCC-T55 TaxID=2748662 RepID=A0A8J7CBL9_9CYAN|nr:response regulator transcription factor [Iningainema tapete]MBD2778501.1 response regulator transcription factor [Iningainema tapete BLCC-T55]
MRVLLVEDEPGIAQFISQGLKEAGYATDIATDGQQGLDYASSAEYDIIVLDIMLPQMDGLQLLRKLRSQGFKTPVLLLTARDAVEDRVRGLDAGADDYLFKPFALSELLARLRALLRRPPMQQNTILRVGDLEMDVATREVRRAGKSINLSPREFTLLEYLMRHPRQVLTRSQITEHTWNFDFYENSNVIDVYIGYLRRKIDHGFDKPLLHTVRGVGYCLNADAAND